MVSYSVQGEIGMQQMGLQARLMSQALRKMSGNASKAGCTLIFLNQIRYKVFLLRDCSVLFLSTEMAAHCIKHPAYTRALGSREGSHWGVM